jgi:L-amino acid N-acyltransferase YncA
MFTKLADTNKAAIFSVLVLCMAVGIALYKKFGFEVEGTHRRLAFRDGEYVDAYSMARLKA